MSYCICSNARDHGYCVGRSFFDRYSCRDFLQPFYPDYFGKPGAGQLLTFETAAEALKYRDLRSTRQLGVNDEWIIREYDSCMNCIGKEVQI